jgi:hypothetical protein
MENDPLNTMPLTPGDQSNRKFADGRCLLTGRAYYHAVKRAEWRNALPFWRRIWEAFKGQFER